MKCEKCGFECDDNSKFCNNCGNTLSNNNPTAEINNQIESTIRDELSVTAFSKNIKKKIITVLGIVMCVIMILVIIFCLNTPATDVLYYPRTLVIPSIMFFLFIISGIVGIIAFAKYNKKILVSAASLFLIALVLYPTASLINKSIIRSDGAPKIETEEDIEAYKDECIVVPYDNLKEESENYQDNYIKYVGKVIKVIKNSDYYSEYFIDISKTLYGYEDTAYVTFPHYSEKSVDLAEDDIVSFYGYSDGLFVYENKNIPKITARYLAHKKGYEGLDKYTDEQCVLVTYDELNSLGNTSPTQDTPLVKIRGKITNKDFYNNNMFFWVDVSDTEKEKIIVVIYDGDEYVKVDYTEEYTFYGMPMENITLKELEKFYPGMIAYKIN